MDIQALSAEQTPQSIPLCAGVTTPTPSANKVKFVIGPNALTYVQSIHTCQIQDMVASVMVNSAGALKSANMRSVFKDLLLASIHTWHLTVVSVMTRSVTPLNFAKRRSVYQSHRLATQIL